MPHIEQEARPQYDDALGVICRQLIHKPLGHLTYVLYVIAKFWMYSENPPIQTRYTRRSCTLGSLRDAHHELRRLHLDPYEDLKINENGEAQ